MKKNFSEIQNPASKLMSYATGNKKTAATPAPAEPEAPELRKGLKRGPKKSTEETKSKRFNLLLFPSVHEDLQKIATMKQQSANDLVNSLLKDFINENQALIEKYNEAFKK